MVKTDKVISREKYRYPWEELVRVINGGGDRMTLILVNGEEAASGYTENEDDLLTWWDAEGRYVWGEEMVDWSQFEEEDG